MSFKGVRGGSRAISSQMKSSGDSEIAENEKKRSRLLRPGPPPPSSHALPQVKKIVV
jgi:hypothetical protein